MAKLSAHEFYDDLRKQERPHFQAKEPRLRPCPCHRLHPLGQKLVPSALYQLRYCVQEDGKATEELSHLQRPVEVISEGLTPSFLVHAKQLCRKISFVKTFHQQSSSDLPSFQRILQPKAGERVHKPSSVSYDEQMVAVAAIFAFRRARSANRAEIAKRNSCPDPADTQGRSFHAFEVDERA